MLFMIFTGMSNKKSFMESTLNIAMLNNLIIYLELSL